MSFDWQVRIECRNLLIDGEKIDLNDQEPMRLIEMYLTFYLYTEM